MNTQSLHTEPTILEDSFFQKGLNLIGIDKNTTKKVLDQAGVTAGVDSIVQKSLPVVTAACKQGTIYAVEEKIIPIALTVGGVVGGLVLLGFVIGKYTERRSR